MTAMAPVTPLWINGEQCHLEEGSYEVRNPLTGDIVGHASAANRQHCMQAIDAAGRAFRSWEDTHPRDRAEVLVKASGILGTTTYLDRVKEIIPAETGISEMEITMQTVATVRYLKDVASMLADLKGDSFPSVLPGGLVMSQRRALGVVLVVAPWNAPIMMTVRAMAVALLCGNTVVVKASDLSPRSQEIVVECFHEAGIPKGVLNFLSISPSDAPGLIAEMIAHPLIRKISFVGSEKVGRIIASEAGKHLKTCVLELGGKAPAVILDDADIKKAARAVASSAMITSGQNCMATARAIVQQGVAEEFISELQKHFANTRAGDVAGSPRAHLATLINENAAENAIQIVKEAQNSGARVLVGDMQRVNGVLQPHLVIGAKPGMRIWGAECFAPVLAVAVVARVEDAIELANTSDYSLVASLWTDNINRAVEVSHRIRAGYVEVNGPTMHTEPFWSNGGYGGSSGFGHFHVEDFMTTHVTVFHSGGPKYYPVVG
ncbi:hypothetical protein EIP91_007644 [Steccherinum ochraceum]|uniref:Aldehyde dehydrogenase domain-containing protein n=1 Tax=Steccherinum ochraceum TaxID=92696 RepID=A0A4R0R3Z5_9APHY|nr:hypothetical protein EIP91_007644 [Steccherinum ochraceum]